MEVLMQDKELRLPDYIQIPGILLRDKSITSLDGLVYGLAYWYSKLKLEKCILSNPQFAQLLNVDARSIQRSLARLEKAGYIRVLYTDHTRKHRVEIIPLITFQTHPIIDDTTPQSYDSADSIKGTTSRSYPKDSGTTLQSYQTSSENKGTTEESYGYDPTVVEVRPYSHHNKNTEEKETNKNNSSNEELQQAVSAESVEESGSVLEGEVVDTAKAKHKKSSKKKEPNPDGSYGNPAVNACRAHFLETMEIDAEDCSKEDSGKWWWNLLQAVKPGHDRVDAVKWLIDRASEDELYCTITSPKELYYKREKIKLRSKKGIGRGIRIAVMPEKDSSKTQMGGYYAQQ
jgi:hypothetical protein